MIDHHAFFVALGELDEKAPAWRAVFAGLAVMRLVDRVTDQREAAYGADASQLQSVRANVEAMSAGDPARVILLRIVDMTSSGAAPSQLARAVVSYGRALDLEARWTLAADVFQSVADAFSEQDDPQIIVEACIALGAAARSTGDWENSASAYARAEHLAARIGDRALGLTAQIGIAGSHMAQGNLPAAEAQLDEVLNEATNEKLETVQALAFHARASVAHCRGDYRQAVQLAYRSLELTTDLTARDRIVADIAAAYAGLGMRATARDGYSIVAMTSPHQWVRWQSTLNLMELALDEGDRTAFELFADQIGSAALDTRLNAYFLYLKGLATRRFETGDATSELQAALEYADSHQLHQLTFQIDDAMSAQRVSSRADVGEITGAGASDEIARIAEALVDLRKSVSEERSGLDASTRCDR